LFSQILTSVEKAVEAETGTTGIRIDSVVLSAFSAGYGAVDEILAQPRLERLVRTLIMLDTLYADWICDDVRVPLIDDVLRFVRFAQSAACGQKTLVLTHADYDCDHAGYCSTRKTADMLLAAVGGVRRPSMESECSDLRSTSECHVGEFHLYHFATRDHQSQLGLLPLVWGKHGLGSALNHGGNFTSDM
jgi:hypothetical protein